MVSYMSKEEYVSKMGDIWNNHVQVNNMLLERWLSGDIGYGYPEYLRLVDEESKIYANQVYEVQYDFMTSLIFALNEFAAKEIDI